MLIMLACAVVVSEAQPTTASARRAHHSIIPTCLKVADTPVDTVAPIDVLTLSLEWTTRGDKRDRVQAALRRSPWPQYLHDEVMKVVECESGNFDPRAVGDDGMALGVLQIRTDYHPKLARLNLFDPDINLLAGYVIFLEAGRTWNPWSCKP